MVKTNYVLSTLLWVGGLGLWAAACDGKAVGTRACANVDGGSGVNDCAVEAPSPSTCVEGRIEGELSTGWMARRPLWADQNGLHVVYTDRQRGIVRETLSPETGQEVASQADQPCPVPCGPQAVARSPGGDMAISYSWVSLDGVFSEGILLLAGDGTKRVLQQPWTGQYYTMGLGWDGGGFTASLLDGTVIWGTARFTPEGEILAEAQAFGRAAVNFGQYDVETDPETGTTVFVTGYLPGVAVAGRFGRDTSLTAPDPTWVIDRGDKASSGSTPAVALHGDAALIAWADVDRGILAREVSLPSGQAAMPWTISTDEGNVFKQVAAAWASDHWVVVGQDYRGLVFAEVGSQGVKQRRLLNHAPAACAATNTCPSSSSDWRWMSVVMTVAAYGESAWVGLVDQSMQRVENHLTLYTYRVLPLRDGCTFQSLASP
jgi:hypothetical protein